MKLKRQVILLMFFIGIVLQGCTSVGSLQRISVDAYVDSYPQAELIPLKTPRPIKTIEVWDNVSNARVEKDVLSLTADDIRKRLTSTKTFITIEKKNNNGSFSYLSAGGKVSKGTYRVIFDYVNSTNQKVTFSTGETALGKIGVGLRITAIIYSNSKEINLLGLLPLGLAASTEKVTGTLSFEVMGIYNDKLALSIPQESLDLSLESVKSAFEGALATRILFGLDETTIEPYLIGVAEVKPNEATRISREVERALVR